MCWGQDRMATMVHISHRELINLTEVATAARYVVNRGTTGDIQRLEAALKMLDKTNESTEPRVIREGRVFGDAQIVPFGAPHSSIRVIED